MRKEHKCFCRACTIAEECRVKQLEEKINKSSWYKKVLKNLKIFKEES